jgi:hypothetical protein
VANSKSYPGSFADTFEVLNPSWVAGTNGKHTNRSNPSTRTKLELLGIVDDRSNIFYRAGQFEHTFHAPGEAQADFGEALVVIAGVEQKAHFLAMDCPHSDDGFVAAFPGETTEAFQQGHVLSFQYFGAVPTRILYDNTKIAVARILGGEERMKTKAFLELQSHYLFADKFGRPGKGNDKGGVEGLVGYTRRNFMVPIPSVNSWEELNTFLHPSDEDLSLGTPAWQGSVVSGESGGCAAIRRRLASDSSVTGRRCCRCPLLHLWLFRPVKAPQR